MNDNSEFFFSIPGDIPTILSFPIVATFQTMTILSFPIVATFQTITILSFPIVATFNQLFACTALVLPSRCSSYFRRALIHRIIYFSFSLCGFNLIYSPLFQLATYQWNCVPEISLWNQTSFLQRRIPIKRALCKDFWNERFKLSFVLPIPISCERASPV